MGRSLLDLRALCPSLLEFARLVLVYLRLLRDGRPGRPRPIAPRRLRLTLTGRAHDWWVGDAGEIGALWEVFIANQYGDWLPADARLVFDLGANVGTATAWLRRRYPSARIVAVEPNPGAADRLRRNMGDDPGVEIVEAAVADHDGTIAFAEGAWTMTGQVVDGDDWTTLQVRALTLDTLRESVAAAETPIDLLKIDTEGGEWRILGASLQDIAAVAMEIHEPTPDGRSPDDVLGAVAAREGLELRAGSSERIRWLLRTETSRRPGAAPEPAPVSSGQA
jgi:FkbM family methyltransferase